MVHASFLGRLTAGRTGRPNGRDRAGPFKIPQ
jgi:hypothetical protein